MKRVIALSVLLLLNIATYSQVPNRKKLDSLFSALEAHNLAAGSIMITSDGKPVYQRSFGKDQTAQTEYRVGSITKVFTAVLIYQLIEAKKYPLIPNSLLITLNCPMRKRLR